MSNGLIIVKYAHKLIFHLLDTFFNQTVIFDLLQIGYIIHMEKKERIEIRISGKHGKLELTPDLYDINDIKHLLEDVEQMLFPVAEKGRPLISYDLEEGSVVHKFQTSRQTVVGFDAVLHDIQKESSIDLLEYKSALAFERLQKTADEKNHTFEISTSVSEPGKPFVISPETTWKRTEDIWVEAEFYFYGELTDAGGKSSINIHIDTKEHGSVAIKTEKYFLKNKEENMLYRPYGIRAIGKQHLQTGEIDTGTLKLVELIDIQEKYDENYLGRLIEQATPHWEGIDADDWLNQLRGNYEL